jgi:hypothetical protein
MAIAYAVSVLASYESAELKLFVKSIIIDIALKQNGWNGVHFVTMCNLVLSVLHHSKDKNELVLDILWELLVHTDGRVRRNVTKLFQLMVRPRSLVLLLIFCLWNILPFKFLYRLLLSEYISVLVFFNFLFAVFFF